MLRGFFANLIFAIIARMLCGNHLKTFSRNINVSAFITKFSSELQNKDYEKVRVGDEKLL